MKNEVAETMLNEIRYAVRTLRKNPGFTAVAVCSLAIGIGANSAIYSLADALLLRPMPVVEPSRMVSITNMQSNALFPAAGMSYPDYEDFRDRNHSFSGVTATKIGAFGFTPHRRLQPHRIFGLSVSSNFFEVSGVQPRLGRAFQKDEARVGAGEPLAVISHEFWASEFGASASILGKKIWLNGSEFTIIGVMPPAFKSFEGQVKEAVFIPLAVTPKVTAEDFLKRRDMRMLEVRGRLKPGITLAQAQADVDTITAGINREYPHAGRELRPRIQTELEYRVTIQTGNAITIKLLAGMALCVLLIACANVAGLLLSRSTARAREIAVRLAIGARRATLVRQLLLESLLISLAGGTAGLLIAYAGVQLFRSVPTPPDYPLALHFDVDGNVLLFTAAVAFVSTILFGLIPALRASKPSLVPALKQIDAVNPGRGRLWGRNTLVAGQVALSLVLLAVSGFMFEGFRTEILGGPGFRVDKIATTTFDPGLIHYSPEQIQNFYARLLKTVRSSPNVDSAALSSLVPFEAPGSMLGVIPDGTQLRRDQEALTVFDGVVTDGFFETFEIPVVKGRGFAETDRADSPRVAIVNQRFAEHYWPHQNAVGKTMRLWHSDGTVVQVVGVTRNFKYSWMAESPTDFVFLPLSQNPNTAMAVVASTKHGGPATLLPVIRHAAESVDRNVPIFAPLTMPYIFENNAVRVPHILIEMIGSLGGMALVLAVIGLYGLTAYSVSRRTREIGIRMAIGADRLKVARMVLRQGLILASCGIAAGLILAFLAARAIAATLVFTFTRSGAAWPIAAVSLFLLLTTLAAAYVPARRASLIDPMRALREE